MIRQHLATCIDLDHKAVSRLAALAWHWLCWQGMVKQTQERERFVDAALALAANGDWEAVRLADVADATGGTLADIREYFREKEELADAVFERADRAMLEAAARPEVQAMAPVQRLHHLLMSWLEPLAPHRRAIRQILRNKLEPGHLHVQFPALLRISRTVQWLREGAGRRATFAHRAIEESVLTSIYLTTVIRWLGDESPGAEHTARLLRRLLERAERLESWLVPGQRTGPDRPPPEV